MEKEKKVENGDLENSERRDLLKLGAALGLRFGVFAPLVSSLSETAEASSFEQQRIQESIQNELAGTQKYLDFVRNEYSMKWRIYLHKALCVGAWDLSGVYPGLQDEISAKGAGSPDAWRVAKNGNFKILAKEKNLDEWTGHNYKTPKSFVQWYKALSAPRKGDRHFLTYYIYSSSKKDVATELRRSEREKNENIVPATHFMPMPGQRIFNHTTTNRISVKDFLIGMQYKSTIQGNTKDREGNIIRTTARPAELQDDLQRLLGEPGLLESLHFTVNGESVTSIHTIIPVNAKVRWKDWVVTHNIHTDSPEYYGAEFEIFPLMGLMLDKRIKQVAIVEREKGFTNSTGLNEIKNNLRK